MLECRLAVTKPHVYSKFRVCDRPNTVCMRAHDTRRRAGYRIPAACIFAVRFKGIPSSPGSMVREKVKKIFITKPAVLRDGFFLLVAEAVLILFLGNNIMTWWMGAAMIGIYGIYFSFLARGFGDGDDEDCSQLSA